MTTAVLGRKVRRNVARRSDRWKPVDGGAMVGGFALGLGRTVLTLSRWTVGIIVVVAISFAILFAYRWVTEHEFFALVNLNVQGGQRLTPDEIAAMGGVSVGANVLGINIAEVQRRIAASEWIESVSVTRLLPDGLTIEVKEHEPAFLIRVGDQIFYADEGGRPIAAVGVDKFVSLPLLEKEDSVPVGAKVRLLLEEVGRNALPFGMSQIAWLRQDSAEQFSLYLENPRILVQLDGTDLHATLACLIKLWADLESRGELGQAAFMFVMPGRAWIRLGGDQTF